MSVAWSSGHEGSVVARHEWKGLLKMPGALEDLVERRRLESEEQSANRWGSMPGHLDSSDDEYMPESDDDDDEDD
jgi:WD repeat-containing protein 23